MIQQAQEKRVLRDKNNIVKYLICGYIEKLNMFFIKENVQIR
jgi:hypothetical protein